MEVYYAIGEDLNIPQEFIFITKEIGDCIWFHTKAGAQYSARTMRGGKYLKKNSIRVDQRVN